MKLKVTKRKLSKAQVYPLQTSFLEKVILNSGLEMERISHIEYLPKQHPEQVFGAHFKGLKIKEFAFPGTVDITINAVDKNINKWLKNELVPFIENNFKQWLYKLHVNNDNFCDESRGFRIWVRDNKIYVNE